MAKASGMEALREKMEKRYGRKRVTRRSDFENYKVIPTGSYSLDLALRVGGWTQGRIHEIVGQEGCGKTTLAICSMAEAQKKYPSKVVGYIDMEQTFTWEWAEKLGLDTSDDRFMHIYPDDSEDVSDQIRMMADSGQFSMIVVDSIGGMESKEAFDKDAGDKVVGRNAQVITRMVKHVAALARREDIVILLINQFRSNIGSMSGRDVSAGPKAAKYATTTKVEMSRTGEPVLKYKFPGQSDDDVVGKEFKARVTRNKVAAEGKMGTFTLITQDNPIYGNVGIDKGQEAYAMGIFTGIIESQGGGYHQFPWTKNPKDRIRGRDKAVAFLRENPERAKEIIDIAVKSMSDDVIREESLEISQTIEDEDGNVINVNTGEVVS